MTEHPRRAGFDPVTLRGEIIGNDYRFHSPFGERRMLYADYTASGRNVHLIERYLMKIQERYANTHTEDDETGRGMTEMLHQAERIIKEAVGGDDTTCIVAVGHGATGAIQKLQEILGVYVPPAARDWLERQAAAFARERGDDGVQAFRDFMRARRPVVFLGPYEHHSNEISWRESLAEVVEIRLGADGLLDLADLERQVSDPRFRDRLKIGSFSAASNVTGVRTAVHDVARILHRHGALACFDYAASAAYVEIDMNRDEESFFDAIYFSPHKFLGGPGSSGVLIFNRRIYRSDLPPTFAGGGTVDYVGLDGQEYAADIEAREKAGTPGTLQLMKAALAMQLKQAVGTAAIAEREHGFVKRALQRWSRHPQIELLGPLDAGQRVGLVSFTIRHGERHLHPKFVTRLFNDLFGIQSRAGCSCAGPYGHHLLDIGHELSERYRCQILNGHLGIKPGWVRISFHYTMDEHDFEFLCAATEFVADHGHLFLPLYGFDLATGTWTHRDEKPGRAPEFGLEHAANDDRDPAGAERDDDRAREYRRYLDEARVIADRLRAGEAHGPGAGDTLAGDLEPLRYFHVADPEAAGDSTDPASRH
jgi:selenocysteine lyase/cysteine desulfurase